MNPLMKPDRVKTALSLSETITNNGFVLTGDQSSLNLVEELASNFDFNSNTAAGLEGFYQSFIDGNELLDEIGGAVYDTVIDKYAAIFSKMVGYTRERVIPFIAETTGAMIADYPHSVSRPVISAWSPVMTVDRLESYLTPRYGVAFKNMPSPLWLSKIDDVAAVERFSAGRFLTRDDTAAVLKRTSAEQIQEVHECLFRSDQMLDAGLFSRSQYMRSIDAVVIGLQLVEFYKSHEEFVDEAEISLERYHAFLDIATDSLLIIGEEALKSYVRACLNGVLVLSKTVNSKGQITLVNNYAIEREYFEEGNGTIEAVIGWALSGEEGQCTINGLLENQDRYYRVWKSKDVEMNDLHMYHVRNFAERRGIEVAFRAVNAFRGTAPELEQAYANEVKEYLRLNPVKSKDDLYDLCAHITTQIVLKQPLIAVILTEYNKAADRNDLSSRELGTLALTAVVAGWLSQQLTKHYYADVTID